MVHVLILLSMTFHPFKPTYTMMSQYEFPAHNVICFMSDMSTGQVFCITEGR